jgi:hypothetical protein
MLKWLIEEECTEWSAIVEGLEYIEDLLLKLRYLSRHQDVEVELKNKC